MTGRERLMRALVALDLSYEQRPEDDVARVLAADPRLEEAIDLGTACQETAAIIAVAPADVARAIAGLLCETKEET